MIKVGLTGNMGSGKSTVAKIFNILGVPIFFADTVAKKILDQPFIIQNLVSQFGNKILDTSGKISRSNLANIVFRDSDSLITLNSLIHPEVAKEFKIWTEQYQDVPYIIHEAAILFESGFNQYMDEIIYVYTQKNLRIKRIIERDKTSMQEIQQRMSHQWDDDKKMNKSNHLINNGNNDLLIPQVLKIHRFYTS